MSNSVNLYGMYSSTLTNSAWWNAQTATSLASGSALLNNDDETWGLLAQQADVMVSLAMDKVAARVELDLAEETADYLKDKPELAEDYVIVVVDRSDGTGREARTFRRSELLEQLEGEQKAEMETAFKENPLIFLSDDEGIPETPTDDEELVGLAQRVQAFLDKNESVLDILSRQGVLTGA